MTYIKVELQIESKDYPNCNKSFKFLVPSGENSEWIFDDIERFRKNILFKNDGRKTNMDMRLKCSLVSEEQLQVDRINSRFGGFPVEKLVDASSISFYEEVIRPLNKIVEMVESDIYEEQREDLFD